MSLELKSLEAGPISYLAEHQSKGNVYGLCDHRRSLARPAGPRNDRFTNDRFTNGAGVRQPLRADEALIDCRQTIWQLAMGAASEVYPQEASAGQEAFIGQEALVGSDFADVIPLGAGRVALALGDVSGKGLAAALCVPQVLYALRRSLADHAPPARALGWLNRYLCRTDLPAACRSVSLSLVVLDVGTGEAICACAGSEPPLILRAGGSIEAVNAGIRGLGMDTEWTYREVDFLLGEGDALLLATDGITGARRANSGKESLRCEGLAGLAGLALDAFRVGGPPGQVARAVLGGAKAFAGGRFHDDACVLVAIRQ